MADGEILEAVRGLHLAHPELGPKPLLAKLREQQPDLAAGNKEVHEALAALKAEEYKAVRRGARRHRAVRCQSGYFVLSAWLPRVRMARRALARPP